MMKVNNSSKREEHKMLFTQFGVNEPTLGERATLRSTRSNSHFTRNSNWVTRINPNSTQSPESLPVAKRLNFT